MGSFKKKNTGSTSEVKNFPKAVQRKNREALRTLRYWEVESLFRSTQLVRTLMIEIRPSA